MFDFKSHLARQRIWSAQTFGPSDRTKGVVDHIRKELHEIVAAKASVDLAEASGHDSTPHRVALTGEWIDVVILALDGAWRSGATPDQIIEALVAKQAKNETRTWPDWRTMSEDKAIEHDRSADNEVAAREHHDNIRHAMGHK
jgi:hypothetical protein